MTHYHTHKVRQRLATVLLSALSLFLFTLPGHAEGLTKVSISMLPVISSAPVTAAEKLGYFKDRVSKSTSRRPPAER